MPLDNTTNILSSKRSLYSSTLHYYCIWKPKEATTRAGKSELWSVDLNHMDKTLLLEGFFSPSFPCLDMLNCPVCQITVRFRCGRVYPGTLSEELRGYRAELWSGLPTQLGLFSQASSPRNRVLPCSFLQWIKVSHSWGPSWAKHVYVSR